ncbi:MAG: hypothetical protein JST12_00230 [Armatimonadetes bacterium]|nr:hypothetical protein [Armatimonadota bacterium]
MRGFAFLACLFLSVSTLACYNDSDTYLTELRDNLDITNAIIGRFTLYTESYYVKRIEIQKKNLTKNPNDLEAYDNLSVAYDRIGEGDLALKWIREKRKHLAGAPKLQLYSTEANEGTFLIVRWIRGHKPGDVTDAVEAEKHIEKALETNPNAHFGREFAQLACIRAMIQAGKQEDWERDFTTDLIAIADRDHLDHKKLRYGIGGMMVLGAAWNMPVLIQAMAELVPEEGQFASLCKQKLRFIADQNGYSAQEMVDKYPIRAQSTTHGADSSVIRELLRNGQEFQQKRQDWIDRQVAKGIHPDTGGDLWAGFTDVPPIPKERLANSTIWSRTGTFLLFVAMQTLGCGCIIPIVIVYAVIRKIIVTAHRRRKGL